MNSDNVYSILLRNGFELPVDEVPGGNLLWLRGYVYAFIKYKVGEEDKKLLKELLPIYTDNQWLDMLKRFYNNKHISATGLYD